MLSNISSYLFGSYQEAGNDENEVVVEAVEQDDDWMLVGKLGNDSDDLIVASETFLPKSSLSRPATPSDFGSDASRRRSVSCKRLSARRCSTPFRELSPTLRNPNPYPKKAPQSRSSSKSSSQCGMEEGWYVTPPPCFNSDRAYSTRPSSLENLLLEQPGISLRPRTPLANNRENVPPASVAKPPIAKVKSSKVKVVVPALEVNCNHRQKIMDDYENKKLMASYNSAQKMEQKIPIQYLKKNQMERVNKVQHELTSRKKRQRRADLNKNHSGVNNNRKCN